MNITEKKFLSIPVSPLTSDGGQYGQIETILAFRFKVGQIAILSADNQPDLQVKVNRVNSATELEVGQFDKNIVSRIDLTAYTVAQNASIRALEQSRPNIAPDDVWRAVYAEEPATAMRTVLVDGIGNYIGQDSSTPLHVRLSDGSVNIGTVNAELEVQLSHKDNDPDAGDVHDSVRLGNGEHEVDIKQLDQTVVETDKALLSRARELGEDTRGALTNLSRALGS